MQLWRFKTNVNIRSLKKKVFLMVVLPAELYLFPVSIGLHSCEEMHFPSTSSSWPQILNFLQFRTLFSPSASLSRGRPWRWHMVFRIFSLFIAFTFCRYLFLSQPINSNITLVSAHSFPAIVLRSTQLWLVIGVSEIFLQYRHSFCHTALWRTVLCKESIFLNISKLCIFPHTLYLEVRQSSRNKVRLLLNWNLQGRRGVFNEVGT